MKSQEEINQAISRLKQNKEKCAPFTGFGDDAHAAIDAMIETLKEDYNDYALDDLLDDEIFDQFEYDQARSILEWKNSDEDLEDYLFPERS